MRANLGCLGGGDGRGEGGEKERMRLRNLGIEHLLETRTIAPFYYSQCCCLVWLMHCHIYYNPKCFCLFDSLSVWHTLSSSLFRVEICM